MKRHAMKAALAVSAFLFLSAPSAEASTDALRAEAYFNAIAGGNAETIASFYADKAEFHWVGGPLAGVYTGKAQIKGVWKRFSEEAGDIDYKVLEVSESQNGKVSTVTARVDFIGPKKIPVKFILMYENGKIVKEIWQVEKPTSTPPAGGPVAAAKAEPVPETPAPAASPTVTAAVPAPAPAAPSTTPAPVAATATPPASPPAPAATIATVTEQPPTAKERATASAHAQGDAKMDVPAKREAKEGEHDYLPPSARKAAAVPTPDKAAKAPPSKQKPKLAKKDDKPEKADKKRTEARRDDDGYYDDDDYDYDYGYERPRHYGYWGPRRFRFGFGYYPY
ncbi:MULTISPECIES: nuclear transport factor 2 family protein [Rhodomicrobium]|uniref:nuclear transport factor 2 family protein n=1 Tax=Rhodomicrobium TaxID=1068 RepID=UPI0014834EFA|nr:MULTISPECIES: nuclear transport factor 2 family protein [Rhodomicrobium]